MLHFEYRDDSGKYVDIESLSPSRTRGKD